MSIPHTFTTRPDTGFSNSQLGMLLFIAADTMFLGSLFASHILLRTLATAPWLQAFGSQLTPWPLFIVALVFAADAFFSFTRKTNLPLYHVAAVGCASAALCALLWHLHRVQIEHTDVVLDTVWGMYFVFGIVYAVHLIAGVGLSVHALYLCIQNEQMPYGERIERFRAHRIYWHFVPVTGVALIVVFYAFL